MLFVDEESIKVFWDIFVEEESYFNFTLLNNCVFDSLYTVCYILLALSFLVKNINETIWVSKRNLATV